MARKCTNCDSRKVTARFDDKTFMVARTGTRTKVEGLSGWRCAAGGEVEFEAASAHRDAASGDTLVLRNREPQSKEIRRIRREPGLSRIAAARLTGGGHNASSRYERPSRSRGPLTQ